MTDPLAPLWHRADLPDAVFSADEVRQWPEGILDALASSDILRTGEPAKTLACQACGEDHVEDVFLLAPGGTTRAYINCPENGPHEIPLEWLTTWKVDFARLATLVAEGLELAGSVETLVPERVWALGVGHLAGESLDVFLIRCGARPDAARILGACTRFQATAARLVLVPGEVPPADLWHGETLPVIPLSSLARWDDGTIRFDRRHAESRLGRGRKPAQVPSTSSFPTPAGTSWSDVHVTLGDDFVAVSVRGKWRKFTLAEAGLMNKKTKQPNAPCKVLAVLARSNGGLPLGSNGAGNPKKSVAELRKRIRALIPEIEGESILFHKRDRCYRQAFSLSFDHVFRLPVPADVRWTDIEITEIEPECIRIEYPGAERFTNRTYSDDGNRTRSDVETAVRDALKIHEMDLRTLDLVTSRGRPDARGEVLLEILRTQAIARPGNDKAVLELGKFLSTMLSADGDPFDFAQVEEKWVPMFTAASLVAAAG